MTKIQINDCEDIKQTQNTTRSCFSSSQGYATVQTRRDYLLALGLKGDASDDIPLSLVPNPDGPLYPWQLFALLGDDRIEDLIRRFYQHVFDDDDDVHFRDAFVEIAPLQHHIMTQACFWIDAFGGGRAYPGGDFRLQFHHHHNALSVMNAQGAKRWMHHMRRALTEVQSEWDDLDDRILPCVLLFLKIKMQKYAVQHGWKFDDTDFSLDSYIEPVIEK
jgi:truncated hemoglobin YjbI